MGSVAKHVFLVTEPERLEATIRTAYEIARTGRPGPVVVDVPKDVQNWSGVFDGASHLSIPGYRKRLQRVTENKLTDDKCETFLKLLASVGAAADLRRRRRHQRRGVSGFACLCRSF